MATAGTPNWLSHLKALQIQKEIWSAIQAVYNQRGEKDSERGLELGDWVWVKRHQIKNLEPRWKGPFVVTLTTPTALKGDGIKTWIHHSHVRRAEVKDIKQAEQWRVQTCPENPPRVTISRESSQVPGRAEMQVPGACLQLLTFFCLLVGGRGARPSGDISDVNPY